ncbi:MAG: hypothetical protein U1F83_11820 [Verrucomicrobiota bacterium]
MKTETPPRFTWSIVCIFAIAFAWVESAVVFYIRTHVNRLEPYQTHPLPLIGELGPVELVRELATMIMLFTVGLLAGKTWRARWGYAAIAFGVWDIFYYVFLKVMYGWPHSLLDWDILFLLPLPWWGPVLAPTMIAVLMILWGTLASQFERSHPPALSNGRVWIVTFLGMFLALYVFMTDTLRVAGQGTEVIRNVLPVTFNWPLFLVAWSLLSAPVVQELWGRFPGRELAVDAVEAP